nr:MAG TPA: hypothetical protein [Caudoviricetes sp.]
MIKYNQIQNKGGWIFYDERYRCISLPGPC